MTVKLKDFALGEDGYVTACSRKHAEECLKSARTRHPNWNVELGEIIDDSDAISTCDWCGKATGDEREED